MYVYTYDFIFYNISHSHPSIFGWMDGWMYKKMMRNSPQSIPTPHVHAQLQDYEGLSKDAPLK